nr:MAG TPA: hypothetical protein [Caudoviricetes sp.]
MEIFHRARFKSGDFVDSRKHDGLILLPIHNAGRRLCVVLSAGTMIYKSEGGFECRLVVVLSEFIKVLVENKEANIYFFIVLQFGITKCEENFQNVSIV